LSTAHLEDLKVTNQLLGDMIKSSSVKSFADNLFYAKNLALGVGLLSGN